MVADGLQAFLHLAQAAAEDPRDPQVQRMMHRVLGDLDRLLRVRSGLRGWRNP